MLSELETLRYWLALLHIPNVGPVAVRSLLERYPDPAALFHTGPLDKTLEPTLRSALKNPDQEAVERDIAWLEGGENRHIITSADPRYPPLLAAAHSAPLLLYLQGAPEVLTTPQLAIIGSRNPTVTGASTAYDFAAHLATLGMTITSGLALGIDGAAHRGALEVGGKTVAVFATGPDRIYPARHRDLAHAIVEGGGALVSEFPPGTKPHSSLFPRRNRIISGLAVGSLVVEAALRSGSLITARLAAEQGREVFAIPGSIHNPLSRGCHHLIRQGAKLVESSNDILEELAPSLRYQIQAVDSSVKAPEGSEQEPLDEEYQKLLACIDFAPTSVDALVECSGLTADVVSSMLLIMELRGMVDSVPGGYMRAAIRR